MVAVAVVFVVSGMTSCRAPSAWRAGWVGSRLTAAVSQPADRDDATASVPQSRGVVRFGWLVLGSICVALGGIGVIVPGLPTTVFFIAAAACFTRSSPRLEAWVLGLPKIGPAVRDYRSGLGMPRSAKIAAVAMIIVSVSVSVVLISNSIVSVIVVVAGVIGVAVVLRVPTRDGERMNSTR